MSQLLTIGELARRLRVTPRTLRHYESIGLLLPSSVDDRTGYRGYDADAVVRGMHIEQLKAAGLGLAAIGEALAGSRSLSDVLGARRAELALVQAAQRRQLRVIDALLAGEAPLSAPQLVTLPATPAYRWAGSAGADGLVVAVRRTIQRLRRTVAASTGERPDSFRARFPIDLTGEAVPFEVFASVASPGPGSVMTPAARAVRVSLAGPVDLLALAYRVALDAAAAWGATTTGRVVEQYLDLGPSTRTAVLVEVEAEADPHTPSPSNPATPAAGRIAGESPQRHRS